MRSALALRAQRDLEDLLAFMKAGEALARAWSLGGKILSSLEPARCALTSVDYEPLSPARDRRLTHSLIYSRAYADLESFVFDSLSEYLDYLSRSRSFDRLLDSTRNAFRIGTATALRDLTRIKFSALTEAGLVANHHAALSLSGPYMLPPPIMIGFERNYDLDEIARLSRNCGINNMEGWLQNHTELEQYFAARATDTVKSMLKELVLSRNEVSHGPITNVASPTVLRDTIDFVNIFIKAFDDLLTDAYAQDYLETFAPTEAVGVERITPAIFILVGEAGTVRMGDRVLVKEGQIWGVAHICGLQLDGINVSWARFSEHLELGVKLDRSCRNNLRIYPFPRGDDLRTTTLEARFS